MSTITDNFNRADQTNLGTSSEGWSWSNVNDRWDIASNQAKPGTAADSISRADSDLASADHYAQIDVTTTPDVGGNCSIAARFASAADTAYHFLFKNQNTSTWRIFKRVAGSFTQLSSADETVPATPFTIKIECNGTSLAAYKDGVSKTTVTDSAISTGTRAGIYTNEILTRLDNFQAADLREPSEGFLVNVLRPAIFSPGIGR